MKPLALLLCLAACGREVTAPSAQPPTDRSCWLEQRIATGDGSIWIIRTKYDPCPPDSILKLTGWTRVP